MDNMILIPVYDTYDTFLIRSDVRDTGFNEWGGGTIWLPQEAWRSK
jgi:hypothetical protein